MRQTPTRRRRALIAAGQLAGLAPGGPLRHRLNRTLANKCRDGSEAHAVPRDRDFDGRHRGADSEARTSVAVLAAFDRLPVDQPHSWPHATGLRLTQVAGSWASHRHGQVPAMERARALERAMELEPRLNAHDSAMPSSRKRCRVELRGRAPRPNWSSTSGRGRDHPAGLRMEMAGRSSASVAPVLVLTLLLWRRRWGMR